MVFERDKLFLHQEHTPNPFRHGGANPTQTCYRQEWQPKTLNPKPETEQLETPQLQKHQYRLFRNRKGYCTGTAAWLFGEQLHVGFFCSRVQ